MREAMPLVPEQARLPLNERVEGMVRVKTVPCGMKVTGEAKLNVS